MIIPQITPISIVICSFSWIKLTNGLVSIAVGTLVLLTHFVSSVHFVEQLLNLMEAQHSIVLELNYRLKSCGEYCLQSKLEFAMRLLLL